MITQDDKQRVTVCFIQPATENQHTVIKSHIGDAIRIDDDGTLMVMLGNKIVALYISDLWLWASVD